MKHKNKIAYVAVLATIATLMQLFTNCGKMVSSQKASSEKTGASAGGPLVTNNSNVKSGNQSGLIQVIGQCSTAAGNVTLAGPTATAAEAECKNGLFQICTVVSGLGNNTINIGQGEATIPLTIYNEYPISKIPGLQITNVVVNNPSSGTVTISCVPGSALSATIYGGEQLAGPQKTCPTSGTLTFNVGLVASLEGTGQRVVYVTQITQSGTTTTIFVDVDHVVTSHTCSITYGQDAEALCAGQAGTVSGSCKGGAPVQIKVNDEVQQTVPCRENGSYSADNVVLTKPGSNKVGIYQKSAFNTTCTAEKNVSAFGQIQ
jgi:hypothetical protein